MLKQVTFYTDKGFFPFAMNGYADTEFALWGMAEAALVQTLFVTCSLLSVSAMLAQLWGGGGHLASKDDLGNLCQQEMP